MRKYLQFFTIVCFLLSIGMGTSLATLDGSGIGMGGVCTADIEISIPGIGTFPAVINPDNEFMYDIGAVNEFGEFDGPYEHPDEFDFYSLPVYAIVSCPGGSCDGNAIVDLPDSFVPWNYADPLFDENRNRNFALAYLGSLDIWTMEPVGSSSGVRGWFKDENNTWYDISGSVEIDTLWGFPDYLFYGLSNINIQAVPEGGEGEPFSFAVSNDQSWGANGWPGVVADKIFFPAPPVVEDVDLGIYKSGWPDDKVEHGADLTCFLDVYNESYDNDEYDYEECGYIFLQNVRVVDFLPPGVSYQGSWGCLGYGESGDLGEGVYDPETRTVTWELGDIVVNACEFYPQFEIYVTVEGRAGGTLCNRATVLTNTEETSYENNSAKFCIPIVDPYADAYVSKYVPRRIRRNSNFNYSINYGNSGSLTSENVVVTDRLSSEFVYDSSSSGGVYDSSSHSVTWNIGEINPSASGQLWIKGIVPLSVDLGIEIENCASVFSANDGNPDNNESCRTSLIAGAWGPNDKFADPVEGDISAGDTINYTIRAENEGNMDAKGVNITDILDNDLDDTTLVVNSGGVYDSVTRMITWYIGTLGAKGSGTEHALVTFSVNVRSDATPDTDIMNQAVIYFPDVPQATPTNVIVHTIPQEAIPGDLNGDRIVDRDDLNIILSHRNQPASVYPECDLDADGMITALDARKLLLLCTCPRCVCPVP